MKTKYSNIENIYKNKENNSSKQTLPFFIHDLTESFKFAYRLRDVHRILLVS